MNSCLPQIRHGGLITSNETIQQLFRYILSGLLLNIANENGKNNRKANTLRSQKAYVKLKIFEETFELRKNKTCNEEDIRIRA